MHAKIEADRHANRAAVLKAKRSKAGRADKAKRSSRAQGLNTDLLNSFKDAENVIAEEERAGNYKPGDSEDSDE